MAMHLEAPLLNSNSKDDVDADQEESTLKSAWYKRVQLWYQRNSFWVDILSKAIVLLAVIIAVAVQQHQLNQQNEQIQSLSTQYKGLADTANNLQNSLVSLTGQLGAVFANVTAQTVQLTSSLTTSLTHLDDQLSTAFRDLGTVEGKLQVVQSTLSFFLALNSSQLQSNLDELNSLLGQVNNFGLSSLYSSLHALNVSVTNLNSSVADLSSLPPKVILLQNDMSQVIASLIELQSWNNSLTNRFLQLRDTVYHPAGLLTANPYSFTVIAVAANCYSFPVDNGVGFGAFVTRASPGQSCDSACTVGGGKCEWAPSRQMFGSFVSPSVYEYPGTTCSTPTGQSNNDIAGLCCCRAPAVRSLWDSTVASV